MFYAITLAFLFASVAHLIQRAQLAPVRIESAPTPFLFAPPYRHAAEMAELRKQIAQNKATLADQWK